METIIAFTAMNALLAIVMAAFALGLQRHSASRAGIAVLALMPLMCWALWIASHSRPGQQAHSTALTPSTYKVVTGAR